MKLSPDISRSDTNVIQPQVPDSDLGGGSVSRGTPQRAGDAYEVSSSNGLFANSASGSSAEQIQAQFAQKFAELASDPEAFHSLMQQVYGEGYDRQAAEAIRQRALSGDTTWMPAVEVVSAETLQGGYGAYDAANNKIYLNADLQGQPGQAAQVYAEEFGHFLDTQLRATDSKGDEGELFRRLLAGESLTGAQVAEIRAENDHGTIEVNGEQVSVEFWGLSDIGDAISDGWDSVSSAVSDGWDSVTSSVSDGWDSVTSTVSDGWNSFTDTVSDGWGSVTDWASDTWDSVSETVSDGWNSVTETVSDGWNRVTDWAGDAWDNVSDWAGDAWSTATTAVSNFGSGMWDTATTFGSTIVDTVVDFGTNAWDGITETWGHLSNGEFGEAARAALRGFDRAVLQTPSRLFNGFVDTGFAFVDGVSHILPGGDYIREGAGRVLDGVRAIGNFGIGAARDVVLTVPEMVIDAGQGLWDTGAHLVNGRWSDAASTFGSTVVNFATRPLGTVVDVGVRGLAALANAGGTLVGYGSIDRPASEVLTPDQLADLQATYGDSLDFDHVYVDQGGLVSFGGIAKVVGNTVYLPDSYFQPNGELTAQGFDVMQHELGHVWQNQNGGGDYLHEALFSQFAGWVSGGSRNAAYDWRPAVASGVDFGDLNPEQQAEVIATLSHLTENGGVPDTGDSVYHLSNGTHQNLTQSEVDFLNEALDDLQAGRVD